jgi:hypothetical protein
MHNLEVYKIKFDPESSNDSLVREIFKNKIATILWCSIKAGHVVDQYFNKNILEIANKLNEHQHYCNFLKITSDLNSQFGRVTVDGTMLHHYDEIDHEFWSDIFKAINNQRCFKIEIATNPKDIQELL